MLSQQEPFPAVVVDRRWNLLQANKGAVAMVEFLVGPDVLRPHLTNWTEVVHDFVRSVEADAAVDGTTQTGALLQRLLRYPGVRQAMAQAEPSAGDGPVLPIFQKGEDRAQAVHDHRHARHAA